MILQRLKPTLLALISFLAAMTVSVGDGGAVLVQFPPLTQLIDHADLYAAGLLVVIELFGRLVPSTTGSTLLKDLVKILDTLAPNRAVAGGRFQSSTYYEPTGGASL